MKILLIGKSLFLIVIALLSTNESLAQKVFPFQEGKTFSLSNLKTISGGQYSIDSVDTDLLVMNFWNIGCKGCIAEMDFLNEVYNDLKSESITFWSVTMSPKEGLKDYLIKHPIDWEIKGDVDFMGTVNNNEINIKCMPTTIVLNSSKRILYAQCKPIMEENGGSEFVELLKEELTK